MKLASRAVAAAAATGCLLWAGSAAAYCRTYGCSESDAKHHCEFSRGCLIDSDTKRGPLHWSSSCLSFDVQKDGSSKRHIDYDAAHQAVRAGFAEWLNADCGDGQGPDVRITDYQAVDCRSAEYNQEAGNANIIMFRDDEWPYKNTEDETLALTTLIFNAETAEIYDADIEVNTFMNEMSVGAVGPRDIDFSSVITHEIGHFLGLSHSSVENSTMLPSYKPGNTAMATIERDDVDGICKALPPGRAVKTDSCEPRHGFSAQCAVEVNDWPGTCQTAPGRAGALGSALLALAGFSSRLLRRRLRRADPPRATNPSPRRGPGSAS